MRFGFSLKSVKEGLAKRVDKFIRSRHMPDPNIIMLAAPAPDDPYRSDKLRDYFKSLMAQAYDRKATQIRLQNDNPEAWVQFAVERGIESYETIEGEFATRMMQELYMHSDNRGVAYNPSNPQQVLLDEGKFPVYGSLTHVWLQYTPLAADRRQLVAHLVYEAQVAA